MRKILIVAVVSIVILILLAAFGPFLIPTSTYKNWVERELSKQVDARIIVQKINLRIFPFPGFTIQDFSLVSKDPPFQSLLLLTAKKISGDLSLLGLIKGKIITSINVSDVVVDYRIAAGETNIRKMFGVLGATETSSITVKSVNVSRGRLNISEDGTILFIVDGINMSAGNLPSEEGLGTDLKMSGTAVDQTTGVTTDMNVEGEILFNPEKQEIAARNVRASIAGVQISSDFSVGFGTAPASFDVHVAAPDLNTKAITPLLPLLPLSKISTLPQEFAWQGPIAFDISAKGSKEAYEASLQLDATQANFKIENYFAKGSGLSLKVQVAASIQPQAISISQGQIFFGGQQLFIKGNLSNDENPTINLGLNGTGLSASVLKVYFPKLTCLDDLDELDISLNASGPILTDAPIAVNGSFKAGKIRFAGIELTKSEGTFERLKSSPTDDSLLFPTFRASFAGGQLSGNGNMLFGETTSVNFDVVADHVQMSSIPAAGKLVSGEASLVAKVLTNGSDATTLANNLKLTGSALALKASFESVKFAPLIFGTATWNTLEAQGSTKLDTTAAKKLEESGDEIDSLNASFEFDSGALNLSSVTWNNPQYETKMSATIDSSGMLRGDGTVTIPKGIAAQLIVGDAQKTLLDDKSALVLPMSFSGKIQSPAVHIDQTKFAANIESRAKAPAPKAEPVPAAKKVEQKKTEISQPKPNKVPKAKASPKAAAKSPKQNEEDVLKVMIGK